LKSIKERNSALLPNDEKKKGKAVLPYSMQGRKNGAGRGDFLSA